MTPEQSQLTALVCLLGLACLVLAACIVNYRVDRYYERKWKEDEARWDAENRVRREQRLQAERIERQRMAQEARELSERNKVALQHMLPKPEVAE